MNNEQYTPRPDGRFVSFKDLPGGPPTAPYQWPQDTMRVPEGFGTMPRVEAINMAMVRREAFGMSAQFTLDNTAGRGAVGTNSLQVPKDGDFWMTGIAIATLDSQSRAVIPYSIAYLQLEDAVNNYKLMPEFVDGDGLAISGAPASAFSVTEDAQSFGSAKAVGVPYGGGQRTSIIQPYCFLRGSAIKVTMTIPAFEISTSVWAFYVSLIGWKEYAYAAK